MRQPPEELVEVEANAKQELERIAVPRLQEREDQRFHGATAVCQTGGSAQTSFKRSLLLRAD